MTEYSWWKAPNDYDQDRAIKEHRARLDQVDQSSLGLAESIGKLFQLDQAQGRDLQRIESRIQALTDLLVEAGVVNAEQLEERIRASKQEVQAVRQTAEQSPSVTCASCKMEVPVDGTFFSEMGEVCERCYRGGAGQLL
jgi:hypothetical protein